MNIKNIFLKTVLKIMTFIVIVLFISPIISLILPEPLMKHAYNEIAFQVISKNELSKLCSQEELIHKALDYTKSHLWVTGDFSPYKGKPFDYLVKGIGWCDYHAKVFCKLLATKGIHARYDFLMDKDGNSPHTIAEVYFKGKWRAVSTYLGFIYYKANGESGLN